MNKMRAAIAAILLVALAAPSALAIEGHQETPLNYADFLVDAETCEEDLGLEELEAGKIYWHFVQTQVPDGTTSGTLTINGAVNVESYKLSGKTLHWYAITPDSFTEIDSLSSNVGGDGQLNLSHTCYVEPETTSTPSDGELDDTDAPTLPPDDTLVGSSSPSTGTWTILLVALAGLMASALVLTPSARRNRR
jgi:hypothetical protein